MAAVLLLGAACRGDQKPTTGVDLAPTLAASDGGGCADRLSRLRTDLAAVPRDAVFSPFKELDLPVAPVGARHMTDGGTPLLLRDAYFEHRSQVLPWSDARLIAERIEGNEKPTSGQATLGRGTRYAIFANRNVAVSNLELVIRSIARARSGAPFELALVMRLPSDSFHPYVLPPESPERVRSLHRELGDMRGGGAYEEELARANTTCAPLSSVLTDGQGLPRSLRDPDVRTAIVDAVAACACRGVDVEVTAALLLAATAHVSPYAWWPLMPAPTPATRTVELPPSATVADLVAAMSEGTGGQPVHLIIR